MKKHYFYVIAIKLDHVVCFVIMMNRFAIIGKKCCTIYDNVFESFEDKKHDYRILFKKSIKSERKMVYTLM